jgi:hypothetical protein
MGGSGITSGARSTLGDAYHPTIPYQIQSAVMESSDRTFRHAGVGGACSAGADSAPWSA